MKYEYKLEINKKKTQIKSSKEGVTFLEYHFKVISKKTYITLTSDVKKRIRDGIKKNKYLLNRKNIDFNRVFSSINTYKHSYKYTSSKYIQNTLDKYWYS